MKASTGEGNESGWGAAMVNGLGYGLGGCVHFFLKLMEMPV